LLLSPGAAWRAARAPGLAAALALVQGPTGLQVEHAAPACLLADRTPRLVACLRPRTAKGEVRLFFRAEGLGPEYSIAMRSDTPCYSALLPRPSRTTSQVRYRFEARSGGLTAASPEMSVAVVAEREACAGAVASVAASAKDGRAAWDAPAGAPKMPPGFEGTPPSTATATTGDRPAPLPPPRKAEPVPPTASRPPAPSPPAAPAAPETGGGHALRNVLIVGAGAAAAGGAVVVAQNGQDSGGPATTSGTGLPSSGVSGVYVGRETVNYPGGCVGTDDVVLNLQESGGALSGVLSFTVRSCACCSIGRGANAVSGALSGTSLGLVTPSGFTYSGVFAGNRLTGSLAAPGGLTGTWAVDKR